MHQANFQKLKKEFQRTRCYRKRLKKIMKLRSNEVQGLNPKYLRESYINKQNKTHGPTEIRIKRSCLDFLSQLTDRKRKALERGLTTFFAKNYNLTNTRNYSREWMFFGPVTTKKPIRNQISNPINNSYEKSNLKKKKKKKDLDQKKQLKKKQEKKQRNSQKYTEETKVQELNSLLTKKKEIKKDIPIDNSEKDESNEIIDTTKNKEEKPTICITQTFRKRGYTEIENTPLELKKNQKQTKTLKNMKPTATNNDYFFDHNFVNYFEVAKLNQELLNQSKELDGKGNQNENENKNGNVHLEPKIEHPVNVSFQTNALNNPEQTYQDTLEFSFKNNNLFEDREYGILEADPDTLLMMTQGYKNFI
ncbi:hypothetical protein M0812_11595 [Anaeramoeba flamelloides]|uniref:Uncharacterized protein n=1 Tax=Anaeramoeba flamelloides TaxID=1746091 RepID=A0AAV7ZVU4_9EUKA|nr:hypothetical protein M0812_11595 [Anaeramoeba flamelloides]